MEESTPNTCNMTFKALGSNSVETTTGPPTDAMMSSGGLGFWVGEDVMSCWYAAIGSVACVCVCVGGGGHPNIIAHFL